MRSIFFFSKVLPRNHHRESWSLLFPITPLPIPVTLGWFDTSEDYFWNTQIFCEVANSLAQNDSCSLFRRALHWRQKRKESSSPNPNPIMRCSSSSIRVTIWWRCALPQDRQRERAGEHEELRLLQCHRRGESERKLTTRVMEPAMTALGQNNYRPNRWHRLEWQLLIVSVLTVHKWPFIHQKRHC